MKLSKKTLVLNITFYVVIALIYGVVIFALIVKFNNGTIYLFNKRVDIVLTDSMSERNKNHEDYLSDTTQIQPFDMVVSEAIKEDTEIKEKDCVLFKNPNLNKLVVHRVVNVYEEGIAFEVEGGKKESFNNEEMFSIEKVDGKITMGTLDYRSISITAYSPQEYSVYFVIMQGKNPVETTVETTKLSEGIYKHIVSYTRDTLSPFKTFIYEGTDQDLYISSITYVSDSQGTLTFNATDFTPNESGNYKKMYNPYYLYEIRADKSSTSDGIFERDIIEAKVTGVIPKLGHVIHFIQSIPGVIMLVGITIIIAVASFFWTKNAVKKGNEEVVEQESTEPKENIEKQDKKE